MEEIIVCSTIEPEMSEIRTSLLEMGDRVELMISESVRAMALRDSRLAKSVMDSDQEIRSLGRAIDTACLQLPGDPRATAQDSLFVTRALKIVIDLERISGQCAGIARSVLELNQEAHLKTYIDLTLMAKAAKSSVREALNAFLSGNAALTDKAFQAVRLVDEWNDRIQRILLTVAMEDPGTILRVMKINTISKYLETIADHASDIAETVTSMVKGKDARHLLA
jgi:phosphate transport system protein